MSQANAISTQYTHLESELDEIFKSLVVVPKGALHTNPTQASNQNQHQSMPLAHLPHILNDSPYPSVAESVQQAKQQYMDTEESLQLSHTMGTHKDLNEAHLVRLGSQTRQLCASFLAKSKPFHQRMKLENRERGKRFREQIQAQVQKQQEERGGGMEMKEEEQEEGEQPFKKQRS